MNRCQWEQAAHFAMMNSNMDGSNNPNNDDSRNTSISRNESLDRKISYVSGATEIRPHDVLCGRSKASFNHVGNRRFRSIVAGALDEYNDASSKWAKSMVATKLVGTIHADGGRFLKQKKGNDEAWFELTTQEAKAKVSHAIRDAIAAKDKTKATKSGITSIIKKQNEDNPFPSPQNRKLAAQHRGSLSSVSSTNDICMLPPPSTPPSSIISLTAIAQPIFAMGGSQRFGGGPTNEMQDQMQSLRDQDILRQPLHASVSSMHPLMHGMHGSGLPLNSGQQMMPQLLHQQAPQQLLQYQEQQLQQRHRQQMLSQQQLLQLPVHQPLELRAQPIDAQTSVPSVASGQMGHGRTSSSGTDTDDGDGEFLSLIDTVLGPMGSPTGPQGESG